MNLAATTHLLQFDDLAQQNCPLQRTDARVKLILTLAFIVIVMSFPRYEISALLPMVLFPVSMFALGGIPVALLWRPLLAAAPFAFLAGMANPFLDREPLTLFPGFAVAQGWFSFASIQLRFALAASAAFALTASTGMHRLCNGLNSLGVPKALTLQLGMMHRYIFTLADEASNLLRSVRARSAGNARPGPALYAKLLATLLLRSFDRAERVRLAMAARGFDGSFRPLAAPALRARDLAMALLWLAFFALARTWNLSAALGRLLTQGMA